MNLYLKFFLYFCLHGYIMSFCNKFCNFYLSFYYFQNTWNLDTEIENMELRKMAGFDKYMSIGEFLQFF